MKNSNCWFATAEKDFSKDGLVLGLIGTALFERADIEAALSWLMDAIRAIEKNDDKIFGRVMDFRLVDYLELVSRTALEVRENKLKALVKYYGPKKRQIRPIYEAIISIASVYAWASLA